MKTNYLPGIFRIFGVCMLLAVSTEAFTQSGLGVNTTTPLSILDVNGSFATTSTIITTSTTLDNTHSNVICDNPSPITVTLPVASGCTGRIYTIKLINAGTVSVVRTSPSTIDGATSWLIDDLNEAVSFVSNGGTVWSVIAQITPVVKTVTTGSAWNQGGNALTSEKTLGTISNLALPFITNNTEKMRISPAGQLGLGSTTFDATNPEKLLVNAGTTLSVNVISARGSINSYLQMNIKNDSAGTSASSDIVATANNGTELINYVDLGINSSVYSTPTFDITGINDAYLYSTGNDFAIGNATANRHLKFFTNGTLAANERMRIASTGNVAIGTTVFDVTYPEKLLVNAGTTTSVNLIKAKGSINNYLQLNLQNTSAGAAATTDLVVTADNGSETTFYVDLGINSSNYNVGTFTVTGINDAYLYSTGNDFAIGNATTNKDIKFFTNGTLVANERMRITSNGNVGIGTVAPEQLLHMVKYTATGNTRDDIAIIEERNTTTTATSSLPTLNIIRQVPTAIYAPSTLVPTGILNFGTRVPASSTLNDMAQITAQTYNATSRIDFLTRTGMTNGNPGGGTLATNMTLDGNTLYVANLTGGATTLNCDGSGNIIRTPSDARLKKNVRTIANALQKVEGMRGVSYNWIDKKRFGPQREIGFIAQELELVVPEVVRNGGEYKSVNYQIITALLVEAIKEQQKQTNEQDKDIAQLQQLNTAIANKNVQLEGRLTQLLKQLNATNSSVTQQPVKSK